MKVCNEIKYIDSEWHALLGFDVFRNVSFHSFQSKL